MLRGVYASASGMMAGARSQRTVGNNIANAETDGHRSQQTVHAPFGAMLIGRSCGGGNPMPAAGPLGSINLGSRVAGLHTSDRPGDIRETAEAEDLALDGPGYFVLQGEDGPLLTRDGNFRVDEGGYLATPEGLRLRSDVGYVQVGSEPFQVSEDGVVRRDDEVLAQLEIADPDVQDAEILESGLMPVAEEDVAAAAVPPGDTAVHQGHLESSNVDMVRELTLLMTAQRSYAANRTALQVQEGTLDEAVRLSDGM